ncbi:hypothetical protein CEP54_016227 [Fusarium duplospermum]|uniref:Isochorismatase-like domain-containing protein n=1 Tax=Fusarium duplospermum TaxID=1325734 RepID=A0A428NGR9_9HYPO|nr:hypothetical protein CEP54_016227 [Fusarium duplospermum]
MPTTAFIILDLQQGIIPMIGDIDREGYLKQVAETAKQAREAGAQVIHVRTALRAGYEDLATRNKFMGPLSTIGEGMFTEGHASAEFDPIVAPAAGSKDIVVTKKRTSAFAGSDLDVVLRTLKIDTLALAGVATSGAVLSTLGQAADLDYVVTVVEDLCLDRDSEVHRVLTEKVFPRQATISSAKEWIESLN